MTRQPTGRMEPTPGRHKTRRFDNPARRGLSIAQQAPGRMAVRLAQCHNIAVRSYGSDCGAFHAYNPQTRDSAGVWDGSGGFPDGTVVTPLTWGLIDEELAQRVLEADGIDTEGNDR